MLHPINFTALRYLELGQFVIDSIQSLENSEHDFDTDSEFHELLDSLKSQSLLFSKAISPIKASAISEKLLELDIKRDRKSITLRNALTVFQYDEQPDVAMAFKLISIVLDKYKGVERMNFEAESLALDTLIHLLDSEKYSSAAQLLQLNYRINDLKSANDSFKMHFNTRSTATINKEIFDTKEIRQNLISTYKELAEYINVMAKRKKTSFYIDALTIVNHHRKYFSDLIAKRKGKTVKEVSEEL